MELKVVLVVLSSGGGADGDGGSTPGGTNRTIRKIWNIWIWKSRWWFLRSGIMDIVAETGGGGGAGGSRFYTTSNGQSRKMVVMVRGGFVFTNSISLVVDSSVVAW